MQLMSLMKRLWKFLKKSPLLDLCRKKKLRETIKTDDDRILAAFDQGFESGRSVGLLEGQEIGWKTGFKEELKAHQLYVKQYRDELDYIYSAFGDIFRDIIIKFHGKKNGNVTKLLQYLDYYSPNARDHLDVEALFEHLE